VTSLSELTQALNQLLGTPPHVDASLLPALDRLLTREMTMRLLVDVQNDPDYMAVVAARSYSHSLGFQKVTLLEPRILLPDGTSTVYQVRLHLWSPDSTSGVPLVESKHEHSFDFVSRLLVGEMENQCYRVASPTTDDDALRERLQQSLSSLTASRRRSVERGMQNVETMLLSELGSKQARSTRIRNPVARLCTALDCSPEELRRFALMQGRYEYDPQASTFGGNYVHRLTGYVNLIPSAVLRLQAGDLYHHPHPYVHRLYMPRQSNATILVTTPVAHRPDGASFQHPTWFAARNARYSRRMYTVPELVQVLDDFARTLRTGSPPRRGSLIDVHARSS
jgi:hypothetical protein